MNRNSLLLAAFATLFALPAQADDAVVSKNAGICMAFKRVAREDRDAEQAMRTAPNKQLAKSSGIEWMRRAKTYGNNSNGQLDQVFAFEATNACRQIGIR